MLIKIRLDRSLGQLHKRMQKMMDEMMGLRCPILSTAETEWTPEVDLYETESHLFAVFNLAGVKKEDIEISFCSPYLRVKGKRRNAAPVVSVVRHHKLEMGRGEFERICRLPAAVEEEDAEASYEDGLLAVRMKKKKKPRSLSVEIKS